MDNAKRIASLRARCLERKVQAWPRDIRVEAASLRASEAEPSWQIRRALTCRDQLTALPLAVDDAELLLGRVDWARLLPNEQEEAAAQAYLQQYPGAGGQSGHCEVDRSRAFALGLDGLRDFIAAEAAGRSEPEARTTLRSFRIALEGVVALAENAAAVAEAAMVTAAPERQTELAQMAADSRHVAHQPPATFRQAIQLLWYIDAGIQFGQSVGLVGPGHLDRTLRSFYEADKAAGRITREEALVLIECLYLLVNEHIPDGLAIPVMVGGRDAAGQDLTNELSHLCLEAVRRTNLVYPTVGVCWHEGTPQELVDLTVDLIAAGHTTPAFFGDEVIQQGLRHLGCPPEDACNYINSTCVEITPVGASGVWVASPYFNTCGFLLEELAAQAEAAAAAPDFPAFIAAYRKRLAGKIAAAVADLNQSRQQRQAWGRKPLQSVFTRDCIERGRDQDDGGPRYNWVECSFVGLANLADSLYVIREEVYGEKRLPLAQMKEILDTDFLGHEPERQRWLKHYPKYGNDNAEVDSLVRDTVEFAIAECQGYAMHPDDSPFVPGAFVWVMHERLGRETGATPDGRRAGFPFADGCGPAQGREACGPTAAILSTTSWNQAPLIGGCAFNMKFNRALFDGPGAVERLRDLVLTFLRRGGFEVQINVVDERCLAAARQNPEAYRDLVVRIGGYTDYFVRLTPEMQEEVMLRTGYASL